jgi:CubicO group peptidase (beta-lactamase class C family)
MIRGGLVWFVPACVVAASMWLQAGPLEANHQTVSAISPLDQAAIGREASQLPRLHSLIVSRSGTTIFERYFNGAGPARPANIKSASKSIISALVGIAIDRKLIADVRQPIGPFFESMLTGDASAGKRGITIENLLTMQSGLQSTSNRNYGAWVQSPNWVRFALSRPLERLPGTGMTYSTGNTHLLSAILTNVSGTSTWQFAQESLARPLGFSLSRWPQDPQGIYFGGNDMLLTPRQMLAFGELYRNGGRVNGKQIVPASWIDTSLVPRARSNFSEQMYGYGWWMRDMAGLETFFAWGFGGQFIIVVPKIETVVVSTSAATVADDRRSHRRTVDEIIERLVIEPLAETAREPEVQP